MEKYVVEADEDEGWGGSFATVYKLEEDGSKTEIGWIGGEPEDNTYYRSYSWIVGSLNEAYAQGLKDGRENVLSEQ